MMLVKAHYIKKNHKKRKSTLRNVRISNRFWPLGSKKSCNNVQSTANNANFSFPNYLNKQDLNSNPCDFIKYKHKAENLILQCKTDN